MVGAVKPSPEFNHYFFSSTLAFARGALSHAPGSAYDDDLEENTVALISKLPDGEPIEEGGGEYITFPGVSTDGSHVLMSDGYNSNYDVTGQEFITANTSTPNATSSCGSAEVPTGSLTQSPPATLSTTPA